MLNTNRRRSQADRILCYLSTGKPITPLMALARFRCQRLAARIENLRDAGHNIKTTLVKRGDTRVAEYRLCR